MKPFSKHVICLVLILLVTSQPVISHLHNRKEKNGIILKFQEDILPKTSASMACADNIASPIVNLVNYIADNHLMSCVTVILYDEFFYKSLTFQPVIMELLKSFRNPMIHAQFSTADESERNENMRAMLKSHEAYCMDYIILSQTLEPVAEFLGHQPNSKVVLVPQASQWQINNFLESPVADQLINLLVIADPALQLDIFSEDKERKVDINLYTHKLYADPMGSRTPALLTAWRCDHLTRPDVALFPRKMIKLNGYQLRVVATEQPPYVYQKLQKDTAGDDIAQWDGLEVRLLKFITAELNLTITFQQPSHTNLENIAESVLAELSERRADVAIGGVYLTADRGTHFYFSHVHSHDCAVFMTLASTALPKYRAILGPFRWEVWMAITLAYIFAILPISFSAHHSLRILLDHPYELENMFWYVFGTFTNCFTFTGDKSWTSGKMSSTRMFIGTYWAFSIMVSAAYTGSIIAFIMLPKFPEVIETPQQLVDNDFRLILTNNSDLKQSVHNSSDNVILQLSHDLKIVFSVEEAISNVTDSPLFTSYAFLHSREFLKHIIGTKFGTKTSHKKSVFHLPQNCFLPMLVSMMFPPESVLVGRINTMLLRATEGGFINKLISDVAWDQRIGTGKILQASGGASLKSQPPEERQLTLDDTQGMFLLLGLGFTLAGLALIAECCAAKLKKPGDNGSLARVPSMLCSEADQPLESRNFKLYTKDDFLQYLVEKTSTMSIELRAQVHTLNSPQYKREESRSLSAIQADRLFIDDRCPSV